MPTSNTNRLSQHFSRSGLVDLEGAYRELLPTSGENDDSDGSPVSKRFSKSPGYSTTKSPKRVARRALRTSQCLKEWIQELEGWYWPGSFLSLPEDQTEGDKRRSENRMSVRKSVDFRRSFRKEETNGLCIPLSLIRQYDERLSNLRKKLEALQIETQKNYVLKSHRSQDYDISESADDDTTDENRGQAEVKNVDVLTALTTVTVMHSLPMYATLTFLVNVWTARIAILKEAPHLLEDISATRKSLLSAWKAVGLEKENNRPHPIKFGRHGIFRKTFEKTRDAVGDQITNLGKRVDNMLDSLEGLDQTLPDEWIDAVDELEVDYSSWIVEAQARVTRYESRYDIAVVEPSHGLVPDAGETQETRFEEISRMPGEWRTEFDDENTNTNTHTSDTTAAAKVDAYEVLKHHVFGRLRSGPLLQSISENDQITTIVDKNQLPQHTVAKNDNENEPVDERRHAHQDTLKALEGTGVQEASPISQYSTEDETRPSSLIGARNSLRSRHSRSLSPNYALFGEPGPAISVPPIRTSSPVVEGFADSPDSSHASELSDGWQYNSRRTSKRESTSTIMSSITSAVDESLPPFETFSRAVRPKKYSKLPTRAGTPALSPKASYHSLRSASPMSRSVSPTPSMLAQLSREEELEKRIRTNLAKLPIEIKLEKTLESIPAHDTVLAAETPLKSNHFSAYNATKGDVRPVLSIRPALQKEARSPLLNSNSDIRLYYLMQSDRPSPVKLFLRLVSSSTDRVMVRLGRGWADLAEYLQQYMTCCMPQAMEEIAANEKRSSLTQTSETHRVSCEQTNRKMPRPLRLSISTTSSSPISDSKPRTASPSASPSPTPSATRSTTSRAGLRSPTSPTSSIPRYSAVAPIRKMSKSSQSIRSATPTSPTKIPRASRIQPFRHRGETMTQSPSEDTVTVPVPKALAQEEGFDVVSQTWVDAKKRIAKQQWDRHGKRLSGEPTRGERFGFVARRE